MPRTVRRLALLAVAVAVTVLGLPGTASAAVRLPALHVGRLYVTGTTGRR